MTGLGHRLRIIRIIVSAIVLSWITVLFLDIHARLPEAWFYPLRLLQVVPAMQTMLTAGGLALVAFLLMVFFTAVFGRFYCSSLCPLGATQDILGFLRRRIGGKRKYKTTPRYLGWRYGFLALFLLSVFAGSGLIIGLLDPYSHFGRIISQLAVNPAIFLNNRVAGALTDIGSYALPPIPAVVFHVVPFALSLGVLAFISSLVWKNGRTYCNSICPVGTSLGLISRMAPFKVYIDRNACNLCGSCARSCKAGCLDMESQTVDKSRCVLCFNCLTVCKEGGIHYGISSLKREPKTSLGRRNFLLSIGASASLPVIAATSKETPETRTIAISPPGSGSHKHLHQKCTACHLCINACPSNVLQPAFLGYGINGLLQPHLSPKTGYCNFDCVRCAEVCPNGALLPISVEEKHHLQLGKAKFVFDYCVVTLEYKNCGACSEHCPTKAVNMIPWQGILYIPEVDEDLCVGCGACEHTCPTMPLSIYVEGLQVHGIAKTPPSAIEQDAIPEVLEDFPF